MIPEQVITPINADCLVGEAKQRFTDGWRLVQICATPMPDAFELSYSFTAPNRIEHMRLIIPRSSPKAPSITPVYSGAFTYENEMHDLFGIEFDGLKLFYNGAFIKTSIPTPFKDVAVVTAAQPVKK